MWVCAEAFPDATSLSEKGGKQLLMAIATKLTVTNMTVESLLAEIKAASKPQQGKPNIETMAYCGKLTQAWKAHLERGGDNTFRECRQELLKQGMPLAAEKTKRQKRKDVQWSRPDLAWVNSKKCRSKQSLKDSFQLSAQPCRNTPNRPLPEPILYMILNTSATHNCLTTVQTN